MKSRPSDFLSLSELSALKPSFPYCPPILLIRHYRYHRRIIQIQNSSPGWQAAEFDLEPSRRKSDPLDQDIHIFESDQSYLKPLLGEIACNRRHEDCIVAIAGSFPFSLGSFLSVD